MLTRLCLLFCLVPAGLTAAETRSGRVLILGDSVSVAYTPVVRELLKDVADVIRPAGTNGHVENCEGTSKGIKEISRWLAYDGGHWDVIHFNFGLHDLKRVNPRTRLNSTRASHPRQAEPDVYEQQLREIVAALKGTGARLIFATTTPVAPGPVDPLRDPEDVERYNRIACRVVGAAGIEVNDLYAFAMTRRAAWQRPVNVHFNEKGNEALAFQVAATVRRALAEALGTQLRTQAPPANVVPPFLLSASDPGWDVTLWAASPWLRHPTRFDFDPAGRLWVIEGAGGRREDQRPSDDARILVLEDTDHDGRADRASVFVQDPALRFSMGIAVIDNQVIVSTASDLVIYTDVNRDQKFDPAIDRREVLLTGFKGHEHSVQSVTVGPDGQWYWNAGNGGAQFTDGSGQTFRIGRACGTDNPETSAETPRWDPRALAGQPSDDGQVWIGGFAARMHPDGSRVQIIEHNLCHSSELAVTSFGDVFQNDHDDSHAGRTAYLMEFGNAGFCSADGQRAWPVDRRPGQAASIARWHQEDPGVLPAGDIYGDGDPAGIAFVENSALGPKYRGVLLSCEPEHHTVFGYFTKPDGAGFRLERFDFLTSNPEPPMGGAGADFKGTNFSTDVSRSFRPSDVTIGPDGAIYVSDSFEAQAGVGPGLSHSFSGAIYRIAPKDFRPLSSAIDLATLPGAMAGLRSPAVNVRGAARAAILNQHPQAHALASILNDENPYVRARAVWLLSELEGAKSERLQRFLKGRDAQARLVAFRSLRRLAEAAATQEVLFAPARKLATDSSAAVRREVALAVRAWSWTQSRDVLVALAKGFNGRDRWYLEALGIGASGKEGDLYDALVPVFGHPDSLQWTSRFAGLAWRLHPPRSAAAFQQRALATTLPEADRRAALTALAFIGSREAVQAIIDVAARAEEPIRTEAVWWLMNRKDTAWKAYSLDEELKQRGIHAAGAGGGGL